MLTAAAQIFNIQQQHMQAYFTLRHVFIFFYVSLFYFQACWFLVGCFFCLRCGFIVLRSACIYFSFRQNQIHLLLLITPKSHHIKVHGTNLTFSKVKIGLVAVSLSRGLASCYRYAQECRHIHLLLTSRNKNICGFSPVSCKSEQKRFSHLGFGSCQYLTNYCDISSLIITAQSDLSTPGQNLVTTSKAITHAFA